MAGIDATTGKRLEGFPHVAQSIEKVLSTGIGERVMREWVASPGKRLLGENATASTILLWFTSVWAVLEIFEPRFRISRFVVEDVRREGASDFTLVGVYRPYAHLDFEQAALLVSISGGAVTVQAV